MVLPPTSTFIVDRDIPTSAVATGSGDTVLPRNEPANVQLSAKSVSTKEKKTTLSRSYNIVKIFISLVQVLFAVATLYRTHGDQVHRYGAFAPGFTTVPYAWMSLVNLIGNAICPQYNTMYMVGSSGLDHLRRRLKDAEERDRNRFGVVGEVGRLAPEADSQLIAYYRRLSKMTPETSKNFAAALLRTMSRLAGRGWTWGTSLLVTYLPLLCTLPLSVKFFGFGE